MRKTESLGMVAWLHNNENGLNAPELCTLKWVRRSILYFVYVTSIKRNRRRRQRRRRKIKGLGRKPQYVFGMIPFSSFFSYCSLARGLARALLCASTRWLALWVCRLAYQRLLSYFPVWLRGRHFTKVFKQEGEITAILFSSRSLKIQAKLPWSFSLSSSKNTRFPRGFHGERLGLVPQVQMEPLASWSVQALAVIKDPTSRASVNPWVPLAKSGVGPDPRRGHGLAFWMTEYVINWSNN